MQDANTAKTPAEVKQISIKKTDLLTPEKSTYFRAATGSLLYLSRGTQADLTFSVMILSRKYVFSREACNDETEKSVEISTRYFRA